MNILQVHNKYKIQGGEWTVLNQEYDLLKEKNQVERFIVDNTEQLRSLPDKLRLIFTTHYNNASKKKVKQELEKIRPDVMHVHNFFPLLTPSIFDAARETGTPSVLTLHNYRLMHPNGYLMHRGKIDERSIKNSAYVCVKDGVYRNSMLQTAVVAHMIEHHRKKRTWQTRVDAYICLTEFARQKFIEAGFPEKKLFIKPNFVYDSLKQLHSGKILKKREPYYLFIGRISEEKGIRTLLKAWNRISKDPEKNLLILGDGPLKKELESQYASNGSIKWLGFTDRLRAMNYLMRAKALLFPSEWYEGMPMTIIEAFCMGVPVLASNIGSQKEMVANNRTGLHFKAGNPKSFIEKLLFFDGNNQLQRELSQQARNEYEAYYTPEANYQKLISIYEEAKKRQGK